MIGIDLDHTRKYFGKWFLADCAVELNDYTISWFACKAPF